MNWTRLSLIFAFTFAAPTLRADEPRAAAPTTRPSAAATKPAPPKDEPTVPSIKGDPNDPKNGFLKRHEGFLNDKEALLKNGPIQFLLVADSITDARRAKPASTSAFPQYNPYNIGIAGDRPQHVLWRPEHGE